MRARISTAAVVVCALALGACGGGGSGGGSSGTNGHQTVKVGVVPVIDVAPLYLGIKKGFFKDEGLDVRPQEIQAGATIVAATMSGQLQVGFSNDTSLVIASSKGLPVHIIAAGNQAAKGDYAAIMVAKNSPIHKPSDLAGKTIAVNNLNNVGPLTVSAALQKLGVDPKSVKFTEVAFPDMESAVHTHRVDAAWMVEPFVTKAKAGGDVRVLLDTYPEIAPHFPVASYFTTRAQGDLGQRFASAMNRSLKYATAHPDEARAVIPTYIDMPKALAQKVVLPEWSPNIGAGLIRRTGQLAKQYGYTTGTPDYGKLLGGA